MAALLTFLTPPPGGYRFSEVFGIRGAAEMYLRHVLETGMVEAFAPYSAANGQSLRKAAAKIKDATGETFTFEKVGNDYRDVLVKVTRNGKLHEFTRSYLNIEAIRVVNVQAEADQAIAQDNS